MLVIVTCRGVTPLLMNRMSADTLEGLRTKTKKPKSAGVGGTVTPREEAAPKVHLHNGAPIIPGDMLMAALIAAGVFVRLDAKRQVSTAKSTILPGFLSLLDLAIPLVDPDSEKPAAWEPDIRQGRNPNGGEAVCICRPRFDAWQFTARVDIDTTEIGENAIRHLWDLAGKRIGLGDFRPSRKGVFGQFVVDRWEVKATHAAAE